MPMLTAITWLRIGAILGALGVTLGAFGAHGLKERLDAYSLDIYQTAVTYQMYHVPAILVVALLDIVGRGGFTLQLAGWSFTIGILIFSGSLYLLSVLGANYKWLGAITPVGGLFLILGWIALAIAARTAGHGIAVEV